ncbi:MAG TPA: putative sulfate exporter family transporter [Steroidobacteraceae bacterium]|nr:putative sulfate exporter family transporter [Steroidobacteraceae bacterium]
MRASVHRGLFGGIAVVLAMAALGRWLADWTGTSLMGFEKSPLSGVLFAILLGIVMANAAPSIADRAVPALSLCTTTILRAGIVLLGFRLSLATASALGLAALPVVALCIVVALAIVTVTGRAFGLSRELGALIAVGTSICGVTAIAATAPLIRAREVEVSYATACISLFGLAALLVYPSIADALFRHDPRLAGMFLGTAIHDTTQVAGAALMYQEQFHAHGALEAATVTKLVRNLCMAFVIPAVAMLYRDTDRDGDVRAAARPAVVPLFVVGFAAACALRSIGDASDTPFGVLSPDGWRAFLACAQTSSEWALTIAMAAVGLGTRFAAFRALGWRPLALGLIAAGLVGVVSSLAISFGFS